MDIHLSRQVRDENGITHASLISSMEALLASGCDWNDLVSFLGRVRIVWITRDAYLFLDDRNRGRLSGRTPLFGTEGANHTHHLEVSSQGGRSDVNSVCLCSVTVEEPTRVYGLLFQLLKKTPTEVNVIPGYQQHDGNGLYNIYDFPLSAETLASILKLSLVHERLNFARFSFSQQQCRKLASSRGAIALTMCLFPDNGRSIFDSIGNDQGPTELVVFEPLFDSTIDFSSLRLALGNTLTLRVLELTIDAGEPEVHQFLDALAQNGSLVKLEISLGDFTQQRWAHLCDCLRSHPTLKEFAFRGGFQEDHTDETRAARAHAVVDMLRENEVLHIFRIVNDRERVWFDQRILEQQIKPRLKINLYRPRIRALLAEESRPVQLFAFDRALTEFPEIQQDANLRFLFLAAWSEIRAQMDLEAEEEQQQNAMEVEEIQDENEGS